jgi:hypothetical protein
MRNTKLPILLLAISLTSCFHNSNKRVKGNGIITTENINISQFNHVEVSNAIEVIAKQDTAYTIRVVTDKNLVELIEIDADYRYNLTIGVRKGYDLQPTNSIKVYINSPSLKIIEASGASTIKSEGIFQLNEPVYCTASGASSINFTVNAPTAEATLAGASTIILKGKVDNLIVNASSASRALLFELLTNTTLADVSGASVGELNVSKLLKAKASGAATIRYLGDAIVEKEESSAATIAKQ